jgi:hypothetical protein
MSSLGTSLEGFQKWAGICTEEKYPFFIAGNRHTTQDHSVTILGSVEKLRKVTISSVMSICPVRPSAWNKSAPTGRIFINFDILLFFSKIYRENSNFLKI